MGETSGGAGGGAKPPKTRKGKRSMGELKGYNEAQTPEAKAFDRLVNRGFEDLEKELRKRFEKEKK